jgi:hypothetical protein
VFLAATSAFDSGHFRICPFHECLTPMRASLRLLEPIGLRCVS